MKNKILLVLFIISLIGSVILAINSGAGVCKPGEGCAILENSEYNSVFGIKNSYYGIVIFAFLILLTLSHIRRPRASKRLIIHAGIIMGTIVSLYFIYLQQFVLKAYCNYCMVVDVSIILAFVVVVVSWKRRRRWLIH